ncbi:MAG: phosphoserine phosphatase SerB [Sphingomonas sp.]|nr:phosphoserine phosphatase SerB [Sphingomonas sp.]
MFIATLIAADRLNHAQVSEACDRLTAAGCAPAGWDWLDESSAADVLFAANPATARQVLEGAWPGVDAVVQSLVTRTKKLLIADMDSTMITVECIDELADYAGIKPQIAAVTEAAMRGELGFEAALTARVALLAGLDEAVIDQCLAERVTLTPGAATLVRTMRAQGARAVLVSGGFTRFAEPVAAQIGFDAVLANRLTIANGKLDGGVTHPIVGAQTKRERLIAEAHDMAIPPEAVLAVGDGANDLPMIGVAGLGIAFHAKPVVAAAADARIEHNDLTALLYAQGIARGDWVV